MTHRLSASEQSRDKLLPRKAIRWAVLRLWDHAAMYMPLLLMGILALGTYWLVHNTPSFTAPQVADEIRHEVDYFMQKFSLKSFSEAGKLKSEIVGSRARHFLDTDILEIDQIHLRSIDSQGLVVTATAAKAYLNGDGSEVQLTGDARVLRQARLNPGGKESPLLEFRGEFLHVFLSEERLQSHLPVVLIRGSDQFTGNNFS